MDLIFLLNVRSLSFEHVCSCMFLRNSFSCPFELTGSLACVLFSIEIEIVFISSYGSSSTDGRCSYAQS